VTTLSIRLKKLHPEAALPQYAHGPAEDAGMDLRAVERTLLGPGEWKSVPTGLAIEIPSGFEGQVRPRSGVAARHGVTLLNSPGTIDPGYRGEIRVLMINHGREAYTVEKGERIAQLLIGVYAAVEWRVAGELESSERGDGGFGSTGR
jgi:dUTP pyrophosphatase